MKPALRRILAVTAPIAVLAAASTASAGLLDAHPYLTDNKVYPTVVGTDGSSYVDVALRWAPHLLRRSTKAHEMRVTLTGKGRKGAPIRFDAKTVKRSGAHRYEVVRLRIKKKQRGAYANARSIVVSSAHHWDSPSDSDSSANSVAVSNANVRGGQAPNAITGRPMRECDVATIAPGARAANCDLRGADLSGADLSGVNFSGATLDNARLDGAKLRTANLAGASMVGTTMSGASLAPTEQKAFTQPQDGNGTTPGGGTIRAAIYSATTSVDVVMYDFGSTNVVKWLQDAIARGVNVRVVVNSGLLEPTCYAVSPPSPGCVWTPKADSTYAMEYQLAQAAKAAGRQDDPMAYRVQFSSQNFQITHQKTIIVDGADKATGAPLAPSALPATARAIVSTGNLQAFPNFWGQRSIKWTDYSTTPATKYGPFNINPNYLSDPDYSCTTGSAPYAKAPYNLPGAGQPCQAEWSPRDFGVTVTDADMVARIQGVFVSDVNCDDNDVDNVQRKTSAGATIAGLVPDPKGSDPVSATWPETWSNGAMTTSAFQYPPALPGYFNANPYPSFLRGNDLARQSALINSAKTSLWVYNEEMNYTNKYGTGIVDLLAAQAKKGVDVQVVMSGTVSPDNTWGKAYNTLVAAGAKVWLVDESVARNVYVHAKAIVADGIDGWIGSQNIGYASVNWNRELGVGLTSRPDPTQAAIPSLLSVSGMNQIMTSFASDRATGNAWTTQTLPKSQQQATPATLINSIQLPCIPKAYTASGSNKQSTPNAQSGLPTRDPANVAAPPQAP
jgi:phosphatidylserine/phosphatidylglycerophosphate/cardiolipin synthase-like enzyme